MVKIESLDKKRMLIKCSINGRGGVLLIDTGASVGLLDRNVKKQYQLKEGREWNGKLVGAGGKIGHTYICDSIAVMPNGSKVGQFLLTDISSVRDSIERETGETIIGILGLPQMKWLNMQLDFNDNMIIFE